MNAIECIPSIDPPTTLRQDNRRLTGEVRAAADLSPAERRRMYALLHQYFDNITFDRFEQDLSEKNWVILLADDSEIQGFTTLMCLHTTFDGQPVTAFFSGDTIVAREHWGQTLMPQLWVQHIFRQAQHIAEARPYWFLICSGYKTYRCLPVFFNDFYPTFERPTPPAAQRLLDALGKLKFSTAYDATRGIVRLPQAAPLRPNVAEITERRLRDPHVAFFASANPGHIHGDELACIAELTPANLTPAGLRMLRAQSE